MEVKGKVKEALKQPNAMAPAQTNQNALVKEPFRMEIRGTGKK
jgi:hypothetical protein